MRLQHPLFVTFLVVLAATFAAASRISGAREAFLLAFIIAAATFCSSVLVVSARATPEQLRGEAARDDAGRFWTLVVTALLATVVFTAVGFELASGGRGPWQVALALAALFSAWVFGSFVCALHYARLFYDGIEHRQSGGLQFPGAAAPVLGDFLYFSLVLSMTFQVSDVQITSSRLRRIATIHGLLAFLFNVGIVALSVGLAGSVLARN